VLECLLRLNIKINYSCKTGTCQTCMLQASDYEVPAGSQTGLAKNLIIQNYFLSCLLYPDSDIEISHVSLSDLFRKAVVIGKKYLSADVLQLILDPLENIQYYPGQFINLKSENDIVRSYSLASNPEES